MASQVGKEKKRVNNETDIVTSEPLDIMAIQAVGRGGERKIVPALNVGFMDPRHYVSYKALPYLFVPILRKVSTVRVEEWLERTSYLEEDLRWLLRLPHNRFWSQVVYDENLHLCLQSYLSNTPRDYDLSPKAASDIMSRETSLHKLVFLIILRMATYKESKMHHITPKVYGEIIYDNFVFDVPRIMDICVLYWFRNQAIVARIVQNLFMQQPSYASDLEETIPCVMMAFESVEERLGLRKNGDGAPQRIDDVEALEISSYHITDILDIINYITDVSATLFAFLEAYPAAGPYFLKENSIMRIPSFYDLVFPLLEKEVQSRTDAPEYENCLEVMSNKIILSKSFLIRFFRSLVATTCIQPLLESKCDPSSYDNEEVFHLDNFLRVFMEICTEKLFLCHYNYIFPIQTDLDTFSDAGINLDSASVKYILSSIEPYHVQKKAETSHQINGIVTVEDEPSVRPKTKPEKKLTKSPTSEPSPSQSEGAAAVASPRLDEVELMSLVCLVKEIVPDLNDVFVQRCLEYYEFDSEKTIDAVLCNSLPPHLDRTNQTSSNQNQEPEVGIIIDSPKPVPSILSERRGLFDYDEFDVFNREELPMDRIHKGKSNKTPREYDFLTDEGTSSTLKELILKYEEKQENEEQRLIDLNLLYEDEYDDTYDSHGINLIEAQPENELIRPFTVPAVLRQMRKGGDRQAQEEESEEENEEAAKDEQPEKPRDSFCENPEDKRRRDEQRRQTKMRNRGKDPNSTKPTSFSNKERHKGKIANHNRRNQSDFKQSRGMGGFPTR